MRRVPVVLTTHRDQAGPAAGVVRVVADVAREVGPENVDLVTIPRPGLNALLEGDVVTVGVVGLGRQPDLRLARKRTRLADVELGSGRLLKTEAEFLDLSGGLTDGAIEQCLDRLQERGIGAVSAAEAFAPDGADAERRVVEAAFAAVSPLVASKRDDRSLRLGTPRCRPRRSMRRFSRSRSRRPTMSRPELPTWGSRRPSW